MLRRTFLAAGLCVGTLTMVGCASSGPKIGAVPEGANGLLKQFKAAANLVVARLDLAYQNIASYSELTSPNVERLNLTEGDLKDLNKHYKNLAKLLQGVEPVIDSVEGEQERACFIDYVNALRAITDHPVGELTGDRIAAVQKAAAALELVLD